MRFGLIFLVGCTPLGTLSGASEARPPAHVGSKLAPLELQECFGPLQREPHTRMGVRSRGGAGSGRVMKSGVPQQSPQLSAPPVAQPSRQESVAVAGATAPLASSSSTQDSVERVSGANESLPASTPDPRAPNVAQGPAGRLLDWGATVHLSNDDSMSLASAQRVFAALERGMPLSADHIRPHELLNYFSFETAPVASGELFSVQSAAVQDGSTLSLGFAVQGATPARAPLDLTLVVDRSGSMRSEDRMGYSRRGLELMADQFVAGDRIDLVLFDDRVCTPLKNYVVGRDDPALFKETLSKVKPRGSTDLDAGLREAYAIQEGRKDSQGRNQRVMLLTDALLNTGNVNVDLVSEVGRAFEESGVRFTGVGVGADFNDTMLDRLTEKGKGAYVFLGSEAVVDRVFGPGFPSLVQTVAHNVRFSLDLPESLAMERFYGEEASTDPEEVQPIHYYAGTAQYFLQDLALKNLDDADPITLTIEWEDVVDGRAQSQDYDYTVGQLRRSSTRGVHKAQALMAWSDLLFQVALNGHCGEGVDAFNEGRSRLNDGELDHAARLLSSRCEGLQDVTAAEEPSTDLQFSVSVDADKPVTEVVLNCAGKTLREGLSGSDTVAHFTFHESPGSCRVELRGGAPVSVSVVVPEVDTRIRCRLRSGQMFCNG